MWGNYSQRNCVWLDDKFDKRDTISVSTDGMWKRYVLSLICDQQVDKIFLLSLYKRYIQNIKDMYVCTQHA